MRLATFTRISDPKRDRAGILIDGRMVDIIDGLQFYGIATSMEVNSIKTLLQAGESGLAAVRQLVDRVISNPNSSRSHSEPYITDLAEVRFSPPIPDADKFLCIGKNYRAHLEELLRTNLIKEMPQEPTGFIKLNTCLTGHDTEVVRPPSVMHLDYEPELVFVIGRHASCVSKEDAFDYIAGITLLNDLTCRDTQKREVQSGSRFWTAKNAPGFGPLGPYIITMDEVPDPYDIWITCSVNGEQRMRVNTADQIWKLPDILAHFSRLIPMEPGDMFSTGAPGGVAVGKPNAEDLYLKHGDVVECGFENPSMVLRTRIITN